MTVSTAWTTPLVAVMSASSTVPRSWCRPPARTPSPGRRGRSRWTPHQRWPHGAPTAVANFHIKTNSARLVSIWRQIQKGDFVSWQINICYGNQRNNEKYKNQTRKRNVRDQR